MNKKQIIYITVGVLFVLLVGLGVYALFFTGDNQPAPGQDAEETPEDIVGEAPQQEEGGLQMISAAPTSAVATTQAGELLTISPDGTLQLLGTEGELLEEVAQLDVSRIGEVSADPVNSRAVVQIIENGDEARWVIVERTAVTPLASNIHQAAFSKEGVLAITKEVDGASQIALVENDNEEVIFNSALPDLRISWVDSRTLSLTTAPSGLAPGIVYFLDTRTQQLTRVIGNEFGLTALTSPQQDGIIFSRTNTEGENLAITYLSLPEREKQNLQVATLPERCIFSQDTRFVYCSLFSQSPRQAIMPDDYYKGALTARNSAIAQINLESGEVETIAQNLPVDAVDLQLSAQEDTLFFVDKNSKQLYRLPL